jgi:2'-5' RNA ligase
MLEPMPKGKEFEIWPPHITIVPWFPCHDESRLNEILEAVTKRHQSFEAVIGGAENWGREDKFKVLIVKDGGGLYRLHMDVLNTLQSNGFPIHQQDYLGDKYSPHITLRNQLSKGSKYKEGDIIKADRFSLIKQIRLKGSGRMIKSLVKDYELS